MLVCSLSAVVRYGWSVTTALQVFAMMQLSNTNLLYFDFWYYSGISKITDRSVGSHCSLNRCILFSVFYVLPSGVINDDDDDLQGVLTRGPNIFGTFGRAAGGQKTSSLVGIMSRNF